MGGNKGRLERGIVIIIIISFIIIVLVIIVTIIIIVTMIMELDQSSWEGRREAGEPVCEGNEGREETPLLTCPK